MGNFVAAPDRPGARSPDHSERVGAAFGDEIANCLFHVFSEQHVAIGDFAECRDGRLVVAFHQGTCAMRELTRALSGQDHEGEAIRNSFETIFNSYASHGEPSDRVMIADWRPGRRILSVGGCLSSDHVTPRFSVLAMARVPVYGWSIHRGSRVE